MCVTGRTSPTLGIYLLSRQTSAYLPIQCNITWHCQIFFQLAFGGWCSKKEKEENIILFPAESLPLLKRQCVVVSFYHADIISVFNIDSIFNAFLVFTTDFDLLFQFCRFLFSLPCFFVSNWQTHALCCFTSLVCVVKFRQRQSRSVWSRRLTTCRSPHKYRHVHVGLHRKLWKFACSIFAELHDRAFLWSGFRAASVGHQRVPGMWVSRAETNGLHGLTSSCVIDVQQGCDLIRHQLTQIDGVTRCVSQTVAVVFRF